MKKWTITKWVFGTILTILTLYLISFIIIKSQVKHHSGGFTKRIDPSEITTISSPIAIINTNVLSADCKTMQNNLTVLIENGKITNIGEDLLIPVEFTEINGTERFLIPGLVDTHVHLQRSKNDLLLFLANGVTHISIMNSTMDKRFLKWRAEAEKGMLSPKIYIAAGGMSTKKGLWAKIRIFFGDSRGFNTPNQATKAIKEYKKEGFDAIKSYTPNREVYFAIAEACKKQNIAMIGHLPPELTLEDLYASNQSQLAHVEEITKATIRSFGGLNSDNTEEYLHYLKNNVNNIAIKLKENNITISTTIWLMESIPRQKFDIENFLKSIQLEYQNPGQLEGSRLAKGWLPGNNHYETYNAKDNPERSKKAKIFWKAYVDAIHIMTKALIDNKVVIIAGTDSNTSGAIAGFSLHDELESLQKVGLTTSEVLYSATVAPSKWMQTNAGTIEIGKRADLILLKNNPLENINNTRSVESVISNGRLIDKKNINKILDLIKKANNKSRKISINKFIEN